LHRSVERASALELANRVTGSGKSGKRAVGTVRSGFGAATRPCVVAIRGDVEPDRIRR
jgi:hypothetical protein